jgi:Flp pilus assembly protein TadG
MTRLAQWHKSFHRLAGSEQGSALPLVGLGLFMLLGSTGIAIDMSRVQIVQARMSSALDAAGLAAGSVANTSDINAEATKYFNANFPANYMGTQVHVLTVTANGDNSVLVLDVSGTVNTTFMRIFGINDVAVSAHSEITRASRGMELVLVLDTTGSMANSAGGGVSKIAAARSAAADLINILYGEQSTIDNLWIGLVPFAQGVNIGPSRTDWVVTGSQNWGTTSWMGCVEAREASSRDVTDDPPSVARFPKYYWACHTSYNAWYGTNGSRDNCATSGGTVRYKSPLNTDIGPNKYCSQAITQLTSNKTTVLNAISTLQPDGNTHIVLGAAWAWRMLSPRWRGLWGGEMDTEALPLDYNTPLMDKVMILMSDGDNTISNSVYGAYGYLSQGRLGTTSQSTAESRLNTRTAQVCQSMKDNNVIIYTVAFGTSISTTAQNLLRSCASKPEFYFYSPTGEDLQTAFHLIGDSLANLRISK